MASKKTLNTKQTNTEVASASSSKKTKKIRNPWPGYSVYITIFLIFYVFCSVVYGDVFTRAEQESFICSDADLMKHLVQKEWGSLFYWSRWMLIAYKSPWIGGLLLSSLLTLATYLLDQAFRLKNGLVGLSSLTGFAMLAWFAYRGTSLYYKNEPSLIFLFPTLLVLLSAVLALVSHLIFRKKPSSERPLKRKDVFPYGSLLMLISGIILYGATIYKNENEIITARMQLRMLNNDFEGMIEDATKAQNPTRSVAAYYAIALQQQDMILEHLFDIPFHYPEHRLDQKEGNEEYGIFLTDCNFYSGLINASYRSAMDQTVMYGTRVYYLKRMALCAILNKEKDLANKYLTIIEKMPFEQDFVDTYRPMANDAELIKQNASLQAICNIMPVESRFEQNYRTPAFLGYNVGMLKGNNDALNPSIAACLYSKDLPNAIERAGQLKRIGKPIPMAVQEAIAIHGQKNPRIYNFFPEFSPENNNMMASGYANMKNFIMAIQQYYLQKFNNAPGWDKQMIADLKGGVPQELLEALQKEWLGHYVFYYYCGNIKPKKETTNQSEGVN